MSIRSITKIHTILGRGRRLMKREEKQCLLHAYFLFLKKHPKVGISEHEQLILERIKDMVLL